MQCYRVGFGTCIAQIAIDCLLKFNLIVRKRMLINKCQCKTWPWFICVIYYRGRVRHGRHFTFKSVLGDTAVTLVASSVTGTLVGPQKPYVAHGPWLQVLIPDDFVDDMADTLEPLNNPDQVMNQVLSSFPQTFFSNSQLNCLRYNCNVCNLIYFTYDEAHVTYRPVANWDQPWCVMLWLWSCCDGQCVTFWFIVILTSEITFFIYHAR